MFLKMNLFILLASFSLWAQTSPSYELPFSECFKTTSYISGQDCYLNFNEPEHSISGWQFLEVPINYHSIDSKKTKISFKTSANFSLDKKTVIYFNGGPGGTSFSSNFYGIDDINIIYFNQRGAAFSRPETKELFLDPNYYSSEITAYDALAIVKHLGLKKVTAYGHSYGTIPATIFGSLFPENTENVILEGVIFDGTVKLWNAQHRIALLQKYFDKLDVITKENILKYSQNPQVFSGWFSKMAQRHMYSADFQKALDDSLNNIFNANLSLSDEQRKNEIIGKLKLYSNTNAGDGSDTIYFSPTMFNFIGCKELQSQDDYSTFYAVFNDKNKLVPYKKDSNITNYCEKLNITKQTTYSALDYPIQVPVYYFQGTTDGATTVENAIWHYKQSAKGHAKLILAKNAGHAPVVEHLSRRLDLNELGQSVSISTASLEIIKLFKSAINNNSIDLAGLNQIIKNKKYVWVMTEK